MKGSGFGVPKLAVEYDVFVSYAHIDGGEVGKLVAALRAGGLKVWFDELEIADFAGISRSIELGLARSKAHLCWYSATYPLRRACQWELTAAFLAAQREGDPARRVLVINPEPSVAHIHPVELRDAKFGKLPINGDSVALSALVTAVHNHVARLNGSLGDVQPFLTPRWFGMRGVGSTRFVGRLGDLWRIHSLLHANDFALITGTAAAASGIAQLRGLGGIGKSLTAEEYALRFGAAYPGGVFWLRAYGGADGELLLGPEPRESERERQIAGFATALGVSTRDRTAAEVEGALGREIERRALRCLWVVDDVPPGLDGQTLRRWFAPHPLAKTLVTTRSREYAAHAQELDLGVLPEQEAFDLLTWRRKPRGASEIEAARMLVRELGCHPLAVDVTGAALSQSDELQSFADFGVELAREDEDALELAAELADALPNGHEVSIAKTLLRSIQRLQEPARDFLRLASVLAAAPIPPHLVVGVLRQADSLEEGVARHRTHEALAKTDALSLSDKVGNSGARSVHTLVSRVIRFRDSIQGRRDELRRAAIIFLTAALDGVVTDRRSHSRIELDVIHARALASAGSGLPEANLLGLVATYDSARGAYRSAGALLSREVELRRLLSGPEHPDTLSSMNDLAVALKQLGELASARKIHEEVLRVRERLLGPRHPDTLRSVNDLGETLRAQRELHRARELHERNFRVCCEVLGPEHMHTLTSMNNVAETLRDQGDLNGTLKVQEQLVEISRRGLGSEHPQTLLYMSNLAGTLFNRGSLAAAQKLSEEVLEVRLRILGPEHPDTLTSVAAVAATIVERTPGRALKLYEETVEKRTRVLGSEHPLTLMSITEVAGIFRTQGNLVRAREMGEKALAVSRAAVGPDHPATLSLMNNLAETFRLQGSLVEARKMHEEALRTRKRLYGEEHPDTLSSTGNLAIVLSAQGYLRDARDLLEKVVEIQCRMLTNEHPETLVSMNNLAMILMCQGHLPRAHALQKELVEVRLRLWGNEHGETLTAMNNLAKIIMAKGDLFCARKLQEEVLDVRKRVFGTQHPQTLEAMNTLAEIVWAQGERAEGQKLLEETINGREQILGAAHPDTLASRRSLALKLRPV
jgi:tetratricopeptide (TPR) repeat protein